MSESGVANRRFSDRKRKSIADEDETINKKVRNCDKAGCLLSAPTCCLLSNDSCSNSGYTSRWYHMSLGEHFCNNCFDNYYRSGKPGYRQYSAWSHEWSYTARASKPTIKKFVANELLPYWIRCMECKKWRLLRKDGNLDHTFIQDFKCISESKEVSGCDLPEDENASEAKNAVWMMQLVEEPLLKKSPAGPYLKRFLSEDIGLCPIDCSELIFKEIEDIEPFYVGQCGESPIWVKPDEMQEDEAEFAKEALIFSPTYLGLRNLIVAIWNLSPTEWLTLKKVEKYIICRGLVRIYLVNIAEQIINLLTKKGVINYGIICSPSNCKITPNKTEKIIIVGAGISGLSAAKHLHNLGIDVEVLEASSRPFGRMYQETLIDSDAIFIQGLTNNPFTIIALQAKKKIQTLDNSFLVFKDTGEQIPFSITERVDHELYGLIHGAIEWATLKNEDSDWYNTIVKNYKEMSKVSATFRDSEIFHLFLKQFEIEQRADLKKLSLLRWEFITPLMGNDGIMPDGLKSLTNHLIEDLKISYDSEVRAIDYSSDEICISTLDKEIKATKVLVTVPVSRLRSGDIKFTPDLPDFKVSAFNDLGDYYCEKLIMEFPKKFWTRKIRESFGKFYVVSPEEIFFLFIDVTCKRKNSTPTLLTYISQDSLNNMRDLKEKDILNKCMDVLRQVFSCDGAVPNPIKWLLTKWSEEVYGGSSGTYVKVGGAQNSFDDLAKTVDNKLYFAGEATFRNIPSTITGAYLSGLREAAKIIKNLEEL